MNEYEHKAVKLTLAAFEDIERTTDVAVYAVVSYMSEAIRRLHFTSVERDVVDDAVLTELEKKGIEVVY
jgi:hypothetical protein